MEHEVGFPFLIGRRWYIQLIFVIKWHSKLPGVSLTSTASWLSHSSALTLVRRRTCSLSLPPSPFLVFSPWCNSFARFWRKKILYFFFFLMLKCIQNFTSKEIFLFQIDNLLSFKVAGFPCLSLRPLVSKCASNQVLGAFLVKPGMLFLNIWVTDALQNSLH